MTTRVRIWSGSEEAEIRRLALSGATVGEAAIAMGRSYHSVQGHATHHGITFISAWDRPAHGWKALGRRLAYQYGPERADLIVAGKDPKTQADLQRWNALGKRAAA